MKLTFINVGNGDSILVEFPDARFRSGCFVMVIDGGSGEDEEYRENHTGRIRAVDYLEQAGIDHIDCMVSTHIHEDHTCGLLAIAEKWTPSCFFQPFHAGLAHSMRELSAKPEDRESTRKFIASLNAYQKLVLGIEERGGKIHCLRQGGGAGALRGWGGAACYACPWSGSRTAWKAGGEICQAVRGGAARTEKER